MHRKYKTLANNLDGCSGPQDFGNLFSEKCHALYNSVSYNTEDMDDVHFVFDNLDDNIHKICSMGVVNIHMLSMFRKWKKLLSVLKVIRITV